MNAFGFATDYALERPKGVPNPPGAIHVWRPDPFTTRRAPLLGFYAVGRQPEVRLVRGEAFPEFLR